MSATSFLSRASGQLCLRSTVALRGGYSLARTQDSAVIRAPALSALARYYASKSFPPHTVVSMPALSPTMTAGNIGAWQKKVGESIAPGDVLVEIETDKAQMDFEYQEEGVLAKVLKDSGEKEVSVGSPIAVLVEEGEDVSAFESFSIEDAGGAKQGSKEELPSKEAPRESRESRSQESAEEITAPAKAESEAVESDSTGAELEPSLDREPKISPAARKLALEKGVPIGSIKGSGPGGRIVAEDIEKFKPTGGASSGPAAAGGAPAYEDITASGMRKTIANRLTQSWQTNPHYFVASSISVTKLMKLRVALNASANGEYKLSVNDFLIKACAIACRKVPAANAAWIEENGQVVIRQHNVVDVAVAVATPAGLITPIVKNVNGLGLESISSQMKDLGKRARDNKLKPDEYQGGTVTISNMGMNDAIDRFTAVINPPGATIIAIGAPKKVAIPVKNEETGETEVGWDDQIVITGSFDHKVVDGAVGGEFMKELKKVVENPLSLLL